MRTIAILILTMLASCAVETSTVGQPICRFDPDDCPGRPVTRRAATEEAADQAERDQLPATPVDRTEAECTDDGSWCHVRIDFGGWWIDVECTGLPGDPITSCTSIIHPGQ